MALVVGNNLDSSTTLNTFHPVSLNYYIARKWL